MTREIILDTETTGLDARRGDRLIEIGCVEIVDLMPTGIEFHCFINPGRPVHPDAVAIHGLTTEFLKDKPPFAAVVDDFLAFIGDTQLIIHNASFDIGFINMELEKVGRPPLDVARVVDTLVLARRKHPAGPNSLDALCKRYGIDNSKRTKHGALVDSLLLAEVYVELLDARQGTMALGAKLATRSMPAPTGSKTRAKARPRPRSLPARLTREDEAAHQLFIATLGAAAVWKKFTA